MGTFKHPIEIGDPQGERFETVQALVDTGATFCVIPASLLQRLGVTPSAKVRFRLGDGRIVQRDIAETKARLDGRVITTTVVFGDEDAPPLLGVVALETALLAVDPVRQRLAPTEALLMRM